MLGGENVLYRRIRDLREDKDLTQREMGEILMCSQRVYSNYERGDLDIPTEILIKLADFHDVSVDYILNRTDKKNWK
ncbi:MAG: helix-turn-helix transcriptional regulator [Clostridia bacterium]|nr:helix-turn-helix transcriptional regulator [Clostridia bacterium]